MGAAVGAGASVGTLFEGFIVQHLGYRAGFLSLAAAGVLAVAVLLVFMPETQPQRANQFPFRNGRPALKNIA
jgi:predicted MFS family arabinose efflux permease